MQINLVNIPQPFTLWIEFGVLHAKQKNGNIYIECEVPGQIVDYVGHGYLEAMCSIAEGQLVIHKKGWD